MMHNKNLGNFGEEYAAQFLEKKGYKILYRQYFMSDGEIDIIASSGDYIIFVEVKTRTNSSYGNPIESVTKSKQRRIINMATKYMADFPNMSARFDVIEVLVKSCANLEFMVEEINHIDNAFWRTDNENF